MKQFSGDVTGGQALLYVPVSFRGSSHPHIACFIQSAESASSSQTLASLVQRSLQWSSMNFNDTLIV